MGGDSYITRRKIKKEDNVSLKADEYQAAIFRSHEEGAGKKSLNRPTCLSLASPDLSLSAIQHTSVQTATEVIMSKPTTTKTGKTLEEAAQAESATETSTSNLDRGGVSRRRDNARRKRPVRTSTNNNRIPLA